jgi:hypothetical protein
MPRASQQITSFSPRVGRRSAIPDHPVRKGENAGAVFAPDGTAYGTFLRAARFITGVCGTRGNRGRPIAKRRIGVVAGLASPLRAANAVAPPRVCESANPIGAHGAFLTPPPDALACRIVDGDRAAASLGSAACTAARSPATAGRRFARFTPAANGNVVVERTTPARAHYARYTERKEKRGSPHVRGPRWPAGYRSPR